jgi:DnaK suppressor protein
MSKARGTKSAQPIGKRQLDTYRQRLQEELRDLVARVVSVERDLETMAEELDVELMDRVQEEIATGVLSRLDEQERAQAEEVQAALDRIARDEYGRCEACGEPIGERRLDALPTARLCAACQEAKEAAAGA